MAAPGTPTAVKVKPGLNPGQAIVTATPADGTALTFTCYIYPKTGVNSTSAYVGKRTSTKARFVFSNRNWRKLYATVTATNVDGTSADATQASGKLRI
jgi:hypothetical protein